MSTVMGTFKKTSGGYEGALRSLELNLPNVQLTKIEGTKRSENSPDYDVSVKGVKLGVAWAGTYKDPKANGEKKPYVSATMDDPSLPHKVNFSLFANRTDGNFQAIWTRPGARE